MPRINGFLGQPVPVDPPIGASGGVIKGNQGFPVRSGEVCVTLGTSVDCGVLTGKALCIVGVPVAALGVGDGSALGVVGSALVSPEDVLPSGSTVALSEDDSSGRSSDPLQPSNSNGRISDRAMAPRRRRDFLISLQFLRLLCLGGAASCLNTLLTRLAGKAYARQRPQNGSTPTNDSATFVRWTGAGPRPNFKGFQLSAWHYFSRRWDVLSSCPVVSTSIRIPKGRRQGTAHPLSTQHSQSLLY